MRLGVTALLIVLLWMLLRWMMEQRDNLLAWLREPIHRLETGVVHLPLARNWLRVLKATGTVSLILVPLIVVSLLLQLVAPPVATGPALDVPSTILRVAQLLLALAFGMGAIRLSRGNWDCLSGDDRHGGGRTARGQRHRHGRFADPTPTHHSQAIRILMLFYQALKIA